MDEKMGVRLARRQAVFKGEAIINGTVVDKEGDQIIGNVLSKGTTATFEAKKVPGEGREGGR